MRKVTLPKIILGIAVLALLAGAAYNLPPVHSRLAWRLDFARAYWRGVINPIASMPTALPQPQVRVTSQFTPGPTATATLQPTPTQGPTPTPTPSPTPIPKSVSLPAPKWEKQRPNDCGPASLAMYLRFYGWKGDQATIADVIKPVEEDRNVNVEELAYYIRMHVGWLRMEYRVGGDLELLKKFMAAGVPVMIEEGYIFEESYWPNDDRWLAHYLLLTGYDDVAQAFTGQDSWYGADRKVPYEQTSRYWLPFNHVYILLYTPEQEPMIKQILGENWDADTNRQRALEASQALAEAEPQNAFAWFNVGTNLTYFERYADAADAYDKARQIGLPQRMLRYQFGPFISYFHSNEIAELITVVDYALKITPTSEEALLWKGWGLYRQGKTYDAIELFQKALLQHPGYTDATYALKFVQSNP